MKILLIAPRNKTLPEIENAAEVQEVVNTPGLDVTLLQGNVTEEKLSKALVSANHDMLWIAGHGDDQGVMLSDGILPSRALALYVRNSVTRYVFLNTCSSITAANLIAQEANASVIGTITEVGDAEALRTGVTFARYLGLNQNPRMAYDQSRPLHNSNYVYLDGTGSGAIVDQAVLQASDNSHRITRLEAQMREVMHFMHPPAQRVASVAIAAILFGSLYTSWMIKEIRDFYLSNIPAAAVIAILVVALMVLVLWLPDDD